MFLYCLHLAMLYRRGQYHVQLFDSQSAVVACLHSFPLPYTAHGSFVYSCEVDDELQKFFPLPCRSLSSFLLDMNLEVRNGSLQRRESEGGKGS